MRVLLRRSRKIQRRLRRTRLATVRALAIASAIQNDAPIRHEPAKAPRINSVARTPMRQIAAADAARSSQTIARGDRMAEAGVESADQRASISPRWAIADQTAP